MSGTVYWDQSGTSRLFGVLSEGRLPLRVLFVVFTSINYSVRPLCLVPSMSFGMQKTPIPEDRIME